ncbi:MAG: tetratricopeptide repeat protein [Desulfosudaceae bacterium]
MKTKFVLLGIVIVLLTAGCASNKAKEENEALRLRKLAEAYMAENKYSHAYRELMKAQELAPKDPYIHFDLGIFFYNKKKYDLAIEEYLKAIQIKPNFATARNNLGIVYMEKNEWDKAIEVLAPITEDYVYATPHYPNFLMGQAYFYKKDYDQARTHFQEALELEPDYVFARHWLGKTELERGNTEKALRELKKAVEEEPQVAVFYFDLGRAQAALGNTLAARQAFDRCASLAEENDTLQKKVRQQKRLLTP